MPETRSFASRSMLSQIGERCSPTILVLVLLASVPGFAQAPGATLQAETAGPSSPGSAPLTLTLHDALERARINDPQYRSALTDLGLTREDRVQARAGLLPNVSYNGSFIYTQGTGHPPSCAPSCTPRFIANNDVHEYISLADVH